MKILKVTNRLNSIHDLMEISVEQIEEEDDSSGGLEDGLVDHLESCEGHEEGGGDGAERTGGRETVVEALQVPEIRFRCTTRVGRHLELVSYLF